MIIRIDRFNPVTFELIQSRYFSGNYIPSIWSDFWKQQEETLTWDVERTNPHALNKFIEYIVSRGFMECTMQCFPVYD